MKVAISRIEKLTKNKSKEGSQSRGQSIDARIYAERVEKKAYELYEKRGRQGGHDWDDWLEAERIVEKELIDG